jgi:hypothetical protein
VASCCPSSPAIKGIGESRSRRSGRPVTARTSNHVRSGPPAVGRGALQLMVPRLATIAAQLRNVGQTVAAGATNRDSLPPRQSRSGRATLGVSSNAFFRAARMRLTERIVCARGSDTIRSRAFLIMPNVCADSAVAWSSGRSWPSGAGSVKPSAQPTLVRTQHLPPAKVAGHDRYAKIARPLKVSGARHRRLSLRWFEPSTGHYHPK